MRHGWTVIFFVIVEAHRNCKAPVEPVSVKTYNLTMCAMLRDEMPYIIEWIEHHRLQGVDRFLLYDDNSQDDTRLIPLLYRAMGHGDLVELLPVNPYRRNRPPPHIGGYHDQKQRWALDHCNRRCVNISKWIMVVDVDEFMYAPTGGSIWTYLDSMANRTEGQDKNVISQISVTAVRYGTSGIQKSFFGRIHPNPYQAAVRVAVSGSNETDSGFPMVTRSNSNRAPHSYLDKDYEVRYNETCRFHKDPYSCTHAIGKAIWKPERCDLAGVHWCEKLTRGHAHYADMKELRLNHYAFKSREHVEGLLDLMKPFKMAAYKSFDGAWFSSRFDPMPVNLTVAVRESLDRLISMPNLALIAY